MAGNAFASVCGLVMIARVFGTTEPRDFSCPNVGSRNF